MEDDIKFHVWGECYNNVGSLNWFWTISVGVLFNYITFSAVRR